MIESHSAVEESTHPYEMEIQMPEPTPVYSTLIQCLYDEPSSVVRSYPHYSVFRAIDSRDVTQNGVDLPRVHDFAVIWDEDHDSRIIPVIEEMLMAGLLPGVHFVGEQKGTLTIILAARTYWRIDLAAFTAKVANLTQAAGDSWEVKIGMFDHTPGNLHIGLQCEFCELLGL